MTLYETIKDYVLLGYGISFSEITFGMCIISVTKDNIKKETSLPVSNHFDEKTIIRFIEMMISDIIKEV